VGNSVEPAPSPTTFSSFQDYVNYILAHNNITWRNFNVIAVLSQQVKGHFAGFVPLPFLITGAWDEAHTFALETVAQLPEGSRLAVEVPHWIGRGLEPAPTKFEEFEDAHTDPKDRRRIRIPLEPSWSQSLGQIKLPAATAVPSHLLVHIPNEHRRRPYDVAIRQMYQGREVGRVTWRLTSE
jgi:hypothetical protein